MNRLQITGGLHSNSVRILINGIDISSMVGSLSVEWQQGEAVAAHMTLLPDSVEIDTEALAYITALAKKNEQ